MRIEIKVSPKSSRSAVVEKDGMIKVFVTSAPDKGKANKEVIELLAEKFNVSKSRVTIIRGLTSKTKVVEVS